MRPKTREPFKGSRVFCIVQELRLLSSLLLLSRHDCQYPAVKSGALNGSEFYGRFGGEVSQRGPEMYFIMKILGAFCLQAHACRRGILLWWLA